MMTCLKNTFVGHDDAYAYIDALVSNWIGILCVPEINDKTYVKEFRRLEFDILKYVTKYLMKS